jgi:hypothetical protein
MVLLNQMIRTRRFEEFVIELVQMHNEEMEDKTLWDIWLHRIFDKGFDEFKKSLGTHKKAAPTQEEVKSIAMDSKNILAGFVPDEGVNRNGTVQAAGNDSD